MLMFFFKQETAYEMRISNWSSDGCSSDLVAHTGEAGEGFGAAAHRDAEPGDLRQPARHQRGAGIVAGAEPVAHADRDRDDILEHPADLAAEQVGVGVEDRKSTRLNSSH